MAVSAGIDAGLATPGDHVGQRGMLGGVPIGRKE
jgi:hypothetical protein